MSEWDRYIGRNTDAESVAGNGNPVQLLKRIRTLLGLLVAGLVGLVVDVSDRAGRLLGIVTSPQLPPALGLNGGVMVEGVVGGVAQPVSGPLTDVQLRASAVPVTATPAQPALTAVTALIANGESLSAAANLTAAGTPVSIIMDAAWDTNAVSFQGSYDGVLYTNLRVNGAEVSLTGVVASSMEALDPLQFLPCRYLKVRSGTAAAPVNQVGASTVSILARPT